MNRRPKEGFIALLLAIVLVLTALPAADAGPADVTPSSPVNGVRLLSSTDQGVVFEIGVPWQELALESAADGNQYVRISLPGWSTTSQAGAPALPQLAETIGVPFGAALDIRVEVGPGHTQVLPAHAVPALTHRIRTDALTLPQEAPPLPEILSELEEDASVYAGAGLYPGAVADLVSDGVIRQQRIAGVAVYPVQYKPSTRELTVYESVTVHLAFGAQPQAAGSAPVAESAAYEEVLRETLLNYDAARAWRQALPPNPSPEGRGETLPWAPPEPGWRVKVRSDGIYKVTYLELQAAGLPVDTLDPRTFQLFYLGGEAAIFVAGEDDGIFGTEDSLLFYGQAVDSKYTRDNVYWLTYGQGQGARMAVRDGTPGTADTRAYHRARIQRESNVYYIPGMPVDENMERWIWDWIYPPSDPNWTYTLALPSPYAGAYAATLKIPLLGYLDNLITPDHHARVYVNGTLVDDLWWDGKTWQISEVDFPQELLVAGDNTLSVVCPNDTGVGIDVVYIDDVELTYADSFVAAGNEMNFSYDVTGTWKFRVDGFSDDQVAVFDVSNPHSVAQIGGVEVIPSGANYAALFEDSVAAPTGYWAAAPSAYRSVVAIEEDTPSDLRSTANGADHIIVTHAAFWGQVAALTNLRAAQGWRALRVDVQDIYDEFGYGITGISAIHSFLGYAYAYWESPAPSFVVLVGDAHYDPKNYSGYGRTNYLPAYLSPVDPWMGETAADNRYVTLIGDDTLPDMMLGRLAVNSTAEAAAIVSKIVAYEQNPAPGDWNQNVLAVADNQDSGGDFAGLSDGLVNCCVPEPYEAEKVHYLVTHPTVAEARQAILNAINGGVLVVNYIGHASQTYWASEQLFKTSDVPLLTNGGKLPVLLPMTCFDGYFIYPHAQANGLDSLAEVVTRADGRGAAASWSPTGQGLVTGHHHLDTGFFEAVFLDGLHGLGQATTAGKLKLWATGSDLDLLDTYLLFGDPAMEINALEPGADLQVTKSVEPAGPVLPGNTLVYTLTFANNGPAAAQGIVLSDPIPAQLVNAKVVYMSPEVIGVIPGTTFAWQIADLPAGASGSVKVRGIVGIQTPAGEIVNTASIAGLGPDPSPDNNTASVSSTVLPVMRVGSIVLKYSEPAPGRYTLSGQVRISDLARVPVDGATVNVQWTFPNGSTANQQGVTDLLGRVNFRTKSLQSGTHQLCVTDLVKTGVVYAPARNLETCDTVVIP